MTTGTVAVKEDNMTWENLRSAGESWKSIFQKTDMGHMALLRNIRGVFTEVDDLEFCREYMTAIKNGVVKGKQFPFRYYAAIRAVASSNCNHKSFIINALEECVDIALGNFPQRCFHRRSVDCTRPASLSRRRETGAGQAPFSRYIFLS